MTQSKQIALPDYQILLKKIQEEIKKTGEKIASTTIRKKVEMCWKMGKLISENIAKNDRADYGENLFDQLEQDLNIGKRALYQMQNFYKTYPTIPKDNVDLNWTHYRVLAQIKDSQKREYLEHLVIENNWSTNRLVQEVKSEPQKKPKPSKVPTKKPAKKLKPIRGKLFSYPTVKINAPPSFANANSLPLNRGNITPKIKNNEGLFYLDLGFNIFKEIEEKLPRNVPEEVDVVKKNEQYSFVKSNLPADKFNTYKAYLERVVDGDTIRVFIDLGFGIFHQEIIRFKGIDAPESETLAGKKSTKFLENIFKNVDFFVIKTIKNDLYGRYVADVFLPVDGQIDAQKISDGGIYLNQILLDEGVAVIL